MSEQQVSVATYRRVFAALMVLLLLTVTAAFVPGLGRLTLFIAMTIAIVKALLVILYFMHVRYSSHLVRVSVAAGFLWLGVLFGLTFSDYLTRSWLPMSSGWQPERTLPDPHVK